MRFSKRLKNANKAKRRQRTSAFGPQYPSARIHTRSKQMAHARSALITGRVEHRKSCHALSSTWMRRTWHVWAMKRRNCAVRKRKWQKWWNVLARASCSSNPNTKVVFVFCWTTKNPIYTIDTCSDFKKQIRQDKETRFKMEKSLFVKLCVFTFIEREKPEVSSFARHRFLQNDWFVDCQKNHAQRSTRSSLSVYIWRAPSGWRRPGCTERRL